MKDSIRYVFMWSLIIGFVVACSSPERKAGSESYRMKFHVRTEQGVGLSGVPILVEKHAIGTTDPQGLVTTQLRGREGQEVKILVPCPAGYRASDFPQSVRLTKTRDLDDTADGSGTVVEFTCERVLRDVVIVVRAPGGGGLPLRIGTKSAGVTDANGNAQVLVRLERDQSGIEVGIDTESRRDLLPRNPSRTVSFGRNDAIVVYSERLVAEKPKPRVHGRVKVTRPPTPRPTRLD